MIRRRTITSYEWHVATGNETVVLLNCVKSFFRRLELIGGTEQLTTTGKNLFDVKQLQGVPGFEVEGNEITQSGYNISTGKTFKQLCPEITPGTHILSVSNGDFTGMFGLSKPMYKKSAVEVTGDDLNKIVSLVGNPNKTIKYRLQIEKGSIATPYEPYTGGKPSPSPEYQQEITSAGRKSKNLFDINYFKDKNNLQTIQCEGFSLLGITCNLKPNTEYTLSANLTEAKYNLNIANKTKRFSLTSAPSRTLVSNDDGTLYIGFYSTTADLINMDDFMQQYKNIQLEEGNKTDYEPYSDKYLFDVKVTGKNLFDINNYVGSIKKISESEFHTEAKWGTLIGDINLKAGGKYNISYTFEIDSITNSDCGVRIKCTKSDGTVSYIFDLPKMTGYVCNYTKSAVVPVGTVKCEILLYTDVKLKIGGTFKKLMIAEDSENVALNIYEPYTEQFAKIALNEPLRGIGEYNDTITKDGVVRRVLEVPVVECLSPIINGNAGNRYTFAETPNANINYERGRCMSNIGFTNNAEKKKYVPHPYQANFLIRIADDDTIDMVKEKMKDVIVAYTTKEPVTEPLPESVQQQLQALHSENGVTHVFVDSGEVPCGINVEYKTKS